MNTVGNWLNFFIFNQGYHSVHQRYPGIHWSQIPDKLDFMQKVKPDVIVPYWMTLNSAWRLIAPRGFLAASYGQRWKAKLEKKNRGGHRSLAVPALVRMDLDHARSRCRTVLTDRRRLGPVPAGLGRIRLRRADRAPAAAVRRGLVAAEDGRRRAAPVDRPVGRDRRNCCWHRSACGAWSWPGPRSRRSSPAGCPKPSSAPRHHHGQSGRVGVMPGLAATAATDLVGRRHRRGGARRPASGSASCLAYVVDPAAQPLPPARHQPGLPRAT